MKKNTATRAEHIGSRIRSLRLAAGLTQSELAGDRITRNMLSKIENGSATPSLATVAYLSARLNISPGYFFDPGEKGQPDPLPAYRKMAAIGQIRDSFRAERYSEALVLCRSLDETEDDELRLIMAECSLHLGIQDCQQGRLLTARDRLSFALEQAALTCYSTDHIKALSQAYLTFIASFDLASPYPMAEQGHVPFTPELDFCLYTNVLSLFSKGRFKDGAAILSAGIIRDPVLVGHLSGKLALSEAQYSLAKQILTALLDKAPDDMLRYHIYADLELCYLSLSDFRNAHLLAEQRMALFKKMHH